MKKIEEKELEEGITGLEKIINEKPDWYIDCDLNFGKKQKAIRELGTLVKEIYQKNYEKNSLYKRGMDILLNAAGNRDHYVRGCAAEILGELKYKNNDLVSVTDKLLRLLDIAWYETDQVMNALAKIDYNSCPEIKQVVIKGVTKTYILSDSWKSKANIQPTLEKMLTEDSGYKELMIEKIGELYKKDPSKDARTMFGYHTGINTVNLLEILFHKNNRLDYKFIRNNEKGIENTLNLIKKNAKYIDAINAAKKYLQQLNLKK